MNFTKYKNRLYLLVHIIAWAIVFAFPLLFIRKDNVDGSLISFLRYCVVPSAFLIIFYTNYFYLIDKFLFQKKIRTFILQTPCQNRFYPITVIGTRKHALLETDTPPLKTSSQPCFTIFWAPRGYHWKNRTTSAPSEFACQAI